MHGENTGGGKGDGKSLYLQNDIMEIIQTKKNNKSNICVMIGFFF